MCFYTKERLLKATVRHIFSKSKYLLYGCYFVFFLLSRLDLSDTKNKTVMINSIHAFVLMSLRFIYVKMITLISIRFFPFCTGFWSHTTGFHTTRICLGTDISCYRMFNCILKFDFVFLLDSNFLHLLDLYDYGRQ